jgi:hypothetical protein
MINLSFVREDNPLLIAEDKIGASQILQVGLWSGKCKS